MASMQCYKPCDSKTNYYYKTEKCHNMTSHDHKQHSFTDKVKVGFNHHGQQKPTANCSTGIAHHDITMDKKKHGKHGGHEGYGMHKGHGGFDGHGAHGGHNGLGDHGAYGGHKYGENQCMSNIHGRANKMNKKKNKGYKDRNNCSDNENCSENESCSDSDSDNETCKKKC